MAKFTGDEGEEITLRQAEDWTANYRSAHSAPGTIKAHYFGNVILNDILAQDGCVGIRMYYAIDEYQKPQLVLVGVDEDGVDMSDGILADRSYPCPTDCDVNSPLYS